MGEILPNGNIRKGIAENHFAQHDFKIRLSALDTLLLLALL